MLPARLTKDWESTIDLLDELQRRMALEADYELEAANLCQARALFHDDDGIDLFTEMVRKRYKRARPNPPSIARSQFGWRSILYLLKARIDIRALAEQEVKATG